MKRPNVLLLCADMASARHFGCYGDPARVTPNVDALAERGMRFTRAYCASTPCIPARICMMSGQYAHTSGKMAHVKMELVPRPHSVDRGRARDPGPRGTPTPGEPGRPAADGS